MEHELFQSELKRSVDGALVSDIIRDCSSGLNSHRTTAIELILERSIEECRERMFTKAKNSLWRDSTLQPKRTSEAPDTPAPQVQSPAPAPALQPPSQSLPDDATGVVTGPVSASIKYEGSQDSLAPSKPAKMIKKVAQCEEPLADVETNPSPSEDVVELVCPTCHVKGLRSQLSCRFYCPSCPTRSWTRMKCVGCGTIRNHNVDSCTSCRRKFK
jgi:hypothetical protein